MAVIHDGATVDEGRKAVAFTLGMPASEVVGYVVIAYRADGEYETTANLATSLEVAGVLTDVATVIIRNVAAGEYLESAT